MPASSFCTISCISHISILTITSPIISKENNRRWLSTRKRKQETGKQKNCYFMQWIFMKIFMFRVWTLFRCFYVSSIREHSFQWWPEKWERMLGSNWFLGIKPVKRLTYHIGIPCFSNSRTMIQIFNQIEFIALVC